jgi:hypothetical protein
MTSAAGANVNRRTRMRASGMERSVQSVNIPILGCVTS